MKRDQENLKYRSRWLYTGSLKGTSPIDILCHRGKLDTPIYYRSQTHPKNDPYTFRNRVLDILPRLKAVVELSHRTTPSSDDTMKEVTGLDLRDIIRPRTSSGGHKHRFKMKNYGWIDYIQSIWAAVIFGKKLGELIPVRSRNASCSEWTKVPTGGDYLCASIVTLKNIQKEKIGGNPRRGELTRDITWLSPYRPFLKCQ